MSSIALNVSAFFLFLLLGSCSGGRHAVEDADASDAFSWDNLPDVDLGEYLVPWEGPLPVKVFGQENLWGLDMSPIVVPDGQGGAIIVAPDPMGCASMYPDCDAMFAQRLSPEGERLWGDSGVQINNYDYMTYDDLCGNWGNDCMVVPDSSGGFFLLNSAYDENGNDISIYANRVSPDGTELSELPLRLEIPRDELIEAQWGEFISLYPNVFPYYMSNGLLYVSVFNSYNFTGKVFLAILDDNLNVISFSFLNNGIMYVSRLFRVSEEELASVVSTPPIEEDTDIFDLKFLDLDGNIISESLLHSMADFPPDASPTNISIFDEKAGRMFFACRSLENHTCQNSYLFCEEINGTEHTLGLAWTVDARNTARVENIYTVKGDGGGGLYVSGANYTMGGECTDIRCCSSNPDMCWKDLVVQWIDSDGTVPGEMSPAVLETFPSLRWGPTSVFVNSSEGSAIQVWRRPLVNEGTVIPDVIGFMRGFYLCAQRHESGRFAVWPQVPCLLVAKIETEPEEERWFDAVTDGDGGAIVVFYESGYGIWAQRISADGRLLWDSR